jgi:predicted ATPase
MAERIKAVAVRGHTSIRHVALELRDLNVLIGANGAGKSNFVRALGMFGQIASRRLGYYVGQSGGASALLNRAEPDEGIVLAVDAPPHHYRAHLVPSSEDRLIFAEERWGSDPIELGHNETHLFRLIDDGPPDEGVRRMVDLLRGCQVYQFHDTGPRAPLKRFVPTADNLALRYDGGNLAAVLARFHGSSRAPESAAYRRIVGAVQSVAPFFDDFVLETEGTDAIRLRWRERPSGAVFSAAQMSDGTLRFVCLATLLLAPELPRLLILDEPELGLHPLGIAILADLLRQAATRSQVIAATQSVTLINQLDLEDIVVVERSEQGTILRRPDPERLAGWLDDYSLGELWEKNIIGGRPGRAGGSLA